MFLDWYNLTEKPASMSISVPSSPPQPCPCLLFIMKPLPLAPKDPGTLHLSLPEWQQLWKFPINISDFQRIISCKKPPKLYHSDFFVSRIVYKNNSKWTKDPNIRAKTIKLSEENIEINLHDFRLGKGFLDMTQKKKIDKLDFKIKNFCSSKNTIKNVKMQPTKWDKYTHTMYLIRI